MAKAYFPHLKSPLRSSSHRSSWATAFALLGAFAYVVYFYYPIIYFGVVYAFNDNYFMILPMEFLARKLLETNIFPMWNPLMHLGKPFAAEPLAGMFYPPNVLLRLFSVPTGMGLSYIFHHTVIVVSAIMLFRLVGISAFAALVGAIVASLGGYVRSLDIMSNGIQSATWIPVAILCFSYGLKSREWRWVIFLGYSLALVILGGWPEALFFFEFFALGICIARWFFGAREIAWSFIQLAVGHLIGFLCASALLFPLFQYTALSDRVGGLKAKEVLAYSVTPSMLSHFFYSPAAVQDGWVRTVYISIFLAPLLITGLIVFFLQKPSAGSRRVFFLCVAGYLLACLLSLGENLPGLEWLVDSFRIFRIARYPEKLLYIPHLFLAGGVAYALHLCWRHSKLGRVVGVVVGALLCWDLGSSLQYGYRETAWRELLVPPKLVSSIKPALARFFVHVDIKDRTFKSWQDTQRELMYGSSLFYLRNTFNSPSSINLAGYREFEDALQKVSLKERVRLLGLFGVKFLVVPRTVESVSPDVASFVDKDDGTRLFEFHEVRPQAYLATEVIEQQRRDFSAWPALLANAPSTHPVIMRPEDASLIPRRLGTGKATVEVYQSDIVDIETHASAPSLLVLSDAFYPGWIARVDGKVTPILRVNELVRGVVVPEGAHTVSFSFEPPIVGLGLKVTAVTLLVTLLGLFVFGSSRWDLTRHPL